MTEANYSDRNRLMRQLRYEGWTLGAIGQLYGISRERVRLLTTGVKPQPGAVAINERFLRDAAKVLPREVEEP